MTLGTRVLYGFVVATVVACLAITACGEGGKDHCSACKNDSDCKSGECATFLTNSGDKYLLCGNGSSSQNDRCNITQ